MRTKSALSVRGVSVLSVGIVSACMSATHAVAQPHCPELWRPMPAINYLSTQPFIRALAVHDQGPGLALYAGGLFQVIGGATVNNIGRWDGQSWTALGGGIDIGVNGMVHALLEFNDGSGPALFVGGEFNTAGAGGASSIAKWSGGQWSPLGGGFTINPANATPGIIYALAAFDDGTGTALYAGGLFGAADGEPISHIARWNGKIWQPVGRFDLGGPVYALAEFQGELYAGGAFSNQDPFMANIAKWNGSVWTPVGPGMDSVVYCLTVHDDGNGPALYAGGAFGAAGVQPLNSIARWDGANWSPLGSGTSGIVTALHSVEYLTGPILYAGGGFSSAGSQSVNNIAQWKNGSWSAMLNGLPNGVFAIRYAHVEANPSLYVAGLFVPFGFPDSGGLIAWQKPFCPPDLNCDGQVNFFDVTTFLNAYNDMDPIADFNGDFQYTFFDISLFLAAYNAGCP